MYVFQRRMESANGDHVVISRVKRQVARRRVRVRLIHHVVS